MEDKLLIARMLHMIETKDPMFMVLDSEIITVLYKKNYFFGFPEDDSMDNVYLTEKGKNYKTDIENQLKQKKHE